MQGTAATVLAGLYGALKVQGMPPEELRNRRIMIVGAGSAASGVALTIRYRYLVSMPHECSVVDPHHFERIRIRLIQILA